MAKAGMRELVDESSAFNGKFSVLVTIGPEVGSLVEHMKNLLIEIENLPNLYEKLNNFRIYILSLDGYGFNGDFKKIQTNRGGFGDMGVEELLHIFSSSSKKDWDTDREYYFAMFESIEDKLKEKGIDLGFGNLFEIGI